MSDNSSNQPPGRFLGGDSNRKNPEPGGLTGESQETAPLTETEVKADRAAKKADRKARSDKSFLGHPRGLMTLFSVEMWERFSYLGFQAILVLYLSDAVANGGLGYSEDVASSVVAAYGALLYLLSIVGAWISDRMTGTHHAVLWGAIVIAGGHILMGIPTEWATWGGLGLIIIGTGLLKPNINSMVGELYDKGDERRDAGFSIYYAGINIGAFAGPLVAGWLGQTYFWHAGFMAAAVGMVLGVIQYLVGSRHLAGRSRGQKIRRNFQMDATMWRLIGLVVVVIAIAVAFTVAQDDVLTSLVDIITALTIIVPVIFFVWMYRSPKVTPTERGNLLPYLLLLFALVLYNLLYFQSGNTLNLLALNGVDNSVFGFDYPSTWYISLAAIVEIIMGPVLAWLWIKMGSKQPHVAAKVGIGAVFGGIGFLFVALGASITPGGALMSGVWLVICYIFLGMGDLTLQTSGMSATTKLAPRAFASQTMALWFAAMALAQGIQAQIVQLYELENSVTYFGIQGLVVLGYGLLLVALTPYLKKRMHSVA
ncbi:peptide MFS transporter [Flaviflexus massiliensis]|uniref:peptide MFS transporter n=1 Tax=Flaviflexus massiliensis TaxID=1522309 RepID=UPI0009E8D3AB|nr:peptide MFS transporter [Flaviflexus massiliensis]